LHLQLSGLKPDASADWATGGNFISFVAVKEKVSLEGIAPSTCRLSTGCSAAELQGRDSKVTGIPGRSRTSGLPLRKRPLFC